MPPPPAPITGGEKAHRVDAARTFEVHEPKAGASASVEAVAPKGVGALERLRAGEIDLDGYLDLKVNEATAHLHGLGTTELEGVKRFCATRSRATPRSPSSCRSRRGRRLPRSGRLRDVISRRDLLLAFGALSLGVLAARSRGRRRSPERHAAPRDGRRSSPGRDAAPHVDRPRARRGGRSRGARAGPGRGRGRAVAAGRGAPRARRGDEAAARRRDGVAARLRAHARD